MKTYLILTASLVIIMGHPLFAQDNIWEDEAPAATPSQTPEPVSEPFVPPSTAEQDATYVIKTGDTLWDLAFQFLGNPFDWQKIWQVNSYIQNPDLIYPGNQLVIPGKTSSYGSSSPETPAIPNLIPSETFGAADFKPVTGVSSMPDGYPGDESILSSLKKKNILSGGEQASAPFLWSKKDQYGNIYPGNGTVLPPEQGASYQLYAKIKVSLFKDASYKPGDTIDIIQSVRLVLFNNKTVNLVRRTGTAIVRESTGKQLSAQLVGMSDVITGKERIAKAAAYPSLTIDSLSEVSTALSAEVFTRVEETVSPYPFQKVILNKGSTDGVAIGDIFALYHQKNSLLSVIGIVIHTTETSSTLSMVYMRQNAVESGDLAKLVRKPVFAGQTQY